MMQPKILALFLATILLTAFSFNQLSFASTSDTTTKVIPTLTTNAKEIREFLASLLNSTQQLLRLKQDIENQSKILDQIIQNVKQIQHNIHDHGQTQKSLMLLRQNVNEAQIETQFEQGLQNKHDKLVRTIEQLESDLKTKLGLTPSKIKHNHGLKVVHNISSLPKPSNQNEIVPQNLIMPTHQNQTQQQQQNQSQQDQSQQDQSQQDQSQQDQSQQDQSQQDQS